MRPRLDLVCYANSKASVEVSKTANSRHIVLQCIHLIFAQEANITVNHGLDSRFQNLKINLNLQDWLEIFFEFFSEFSKKN